MTMLLPLAEESRVTKTSELTRLSTIAMTFDLATLFLQRSRYYLGEEYPLKLEAALRSIPHDRMWWRANEHANSVGNIVLHLCGNVRQWIAAGVGGAPDVRQRNAEFAAQSGATCDELIVQLRAARDDVMEILSGLDVASLGEIRSIQGRETTVFAAIYHVVEHYSGHTGQVILLAKSFVPGAVKFYDDADGLARPTFRAGKSNDTN